MNIKQNIFLIFLLLPTLANAYVTNSSYCTGDTTCTYLGCGMQGMSGCSICPAGTYSMTSQVSYNTCKSCGQLPNSTSAATFEWYSAGAENEGECKFKYTCASNAINLSSLTITSGIHISNKETYSNPCRTCGLNSFPDATQSECVCAPGTHVKGQPTNITTSTDGQDCVPYIVSLTLNNPEFTSAPKTTLNILTTLNNDTKKYILPGDLNNIDKEHNTQNGITTIRKTIWGKNLNGHNDTGYRIESWDGANFNFNDIQQNHTLHPNWVAKKFAVYQVQQATQPTLLQLYNKNGEKTSECTYNSPNECYTHAPSESGYEFSHWDCKTLNYANEVIPCAKASITTSDNLASISYGNQITLTPNWTANTITLYYKSVTEHIEGPTVEATRTYKYGNQTTPGTPEQITTWNGTYSAPIGKEFTGWLCTMVDEQKQPLMQTSDCGIIDANTDIARKFGSGYILLTAQYGNKKINCTSGTYLPQGSDQCTDCPKGYYCPGGNQYEYTNDKAQGLNACPAGSTSELKSDDITDCYITNQTKICDNNGDCFQIPTNIKLNLTK